MSHWVHIPTYLDYTTFAPDPLFHLRISSQFSGVLLQLVLPWILEALKSKSIPYHTITVPVMKYSYSTYSTFISRYFLLCHYIEGSKPGWCINSIPLMDKAVMTWSLLEIETFHNKLVHSLPRLLLELISGVSHKTQMLLVYKRTVLKFH